MNIKSFGIYLLKKEFMENNYPENYPGKANRPFVLVTQDVRYPNLLWALPVSKAVKYEGIQKKYPTNIVNYQMPRHKSYILVQNIVPIKRENLEAEYMYRDIHVCIKDKHVQQEIIRKTKKMLALIKTNKVSQCEIVQKMYEEVSQSPLKEEIQMEIEDVEIVPSI